VSEHDFFSGKLPDPGIDCPVPAKTHWLDELYCFDEPHISGGNARVTLTAAQAIEWQKKSIPEKWKHLRNNPEPLLEDFCTIHWAWRVRR